MPVFIVALLAAVAQSVERILGKDEVTSSNLVSSSKKSSETFRFQNFSFCFNSDLLQMILDRNCVVGISNTFSNKSSI